MVTPWRSRRLRVAGGLGGENRLRRQSAIRPRRRRVDCNCHRMQHRNRHADYDQPAMTLAGTTVKVTDWRPLPASPIVQRFRYPGHLSDSARHGVGAMATSTITAGDGVNGTPQCKWLPLRQAYIR